MMEDIKFKLYTIKNRTTNQIRHAVGYSPQDACRALHWYIPDCEILSIEEMPSKETTSKAEGSKMEMPVIRTVGVKHARRMHRDDGKYPVLAVLWEDGAISSLAFADKDVVCEHTEMSGGNEAYWAWIAHLSAKGYKEEPIEVENEVKG